jgi:hypothetical protein
MKFLKLTPFALMVACHPGIGPVVPQNSVERKMIGLLQKFDRWDENGDGNLDERELAPAKNFSTLTPAEIIAFYDTGKDGKISLREAQAGYARSDEARKIIEPRKRSQ